MPAQEYLYVEAEDVPEFQDSIREALEIGGGVLIR